MAQVTPTKQQRHTTTPDTNLPPHIDNLLKWATTHGSRLHASVDIYTDPTYGIALRAKQQPPHAHTRIVSCPFNLSLSTLNALDAFAGLRARSPLFPAAMRAWGTDERRAHVLGNFFLVLQFLMGRESFWWAYVAALPQPETGREAEGLGTPLYYAEGDRVWFGGTSLEGAVRGREERWRREWEVGRRVLDAVGEEDGGGVGRWRGCWTWELYRWAATIYSSRGFVSSLVPAEVFAEDVGGESEGYFFGSDENGEELVASSSCSAVSPQRHRTAQTLKCGLVPVLFPVVDLANHDASARVAWFSDVHHEPKDLSIIVEADIPAGQQIFNNYAPKGNTELLLGYGFLIEGNDEVPIAFRAPGAELAALRERQDCFRTCGGGKANYTFHVRARPYPRPGDNVRLEEFEIFEEGCIDLLAILVANHREREFLTRNPGYCPERSSSASLAGSMCRNTLHAISILREKLRLELGKIVEMGIRLKLGSPRNAFQRTAQTYRQGQIDVLEHAVVPLENLLKRALTHSTVDGSDDTIPFPKLVTLEDAYSRLSKTCPAIYESLINIIAEELEVEVDTGIDWAELIESDWAFTLWVLWVYAVILVYQQEPSALYPFLIAWTKHILLYVTNLLALKLRIHALIFFLLQNIQ